MEEAYIYIFKTFTNAWEFNGYIYPQQNSFALHYHGEHKLTK